MKSQCEREYARGGHLLESLSCLGIIGVLQTSLSAIFGGRFSGTHLVLEQDRRLGSGK